MQTTNNYAAQQQNNQMPLMTEEQEKRLRVAKIAIKSALKLKEFEEEQQRQD